MNSGFGFLKVHTHAVCEEMAGRTGEELEGRETGVDLTEMCYMLVQCSQAIKRWTGHT